jgi:hypothetical protein
MLDWRASFDLFGHGELGRIRDLLHGLLGTFVNKRLWPYRCFNATGQHF